MIKRQLHCVFCDKSHENKDCFLAQNWSLDKKKEAISNKKACYICFKGSHRARECKSKIKCMICSKRHHTIMCFELPVNKREISTNETIDSSNALIAEECSEAVLLQTIFVNIGANGIQKCARALIDSGSQNSHILIKITEDLYLLKRGLWNKELREKKIWIADYAEGSPEIELFIGVDFCGQLFTGLIHKLESGLIAYETFLELLRIKEPTEKTSREEEVVKFFNDTLSTDFDGRYMVRLPWTDNSSLPNNMNIAEKRLLSTHQNSFRQEDVLIIIQFLKVGKMSK
ncbi:integrase catalytic domain-containing protein [Trichonephila inaurata madagascariensis]|uniref:Integrase catalytic domain-containing protein n=1 Tax=Trichonephila inaurata madagascariensis TaxID=2747483 RepID=A0A8X6YQM3_9ARAC|nr:integrase catalytic domain-containing protein [Trichonephila inaurata madagascariensis]